MSREYQYKVSRPSGYFTTKKEVTDIDNGSYWTETNGHVLTPHGIVIGRSSIYYDGKKSWPRSQVSFVHNGHEYTKSVFKYYSERFMVTFANRFVEEVVNES